MDVKCENCLNPHNKEYGSGRFCSQKCARSFSTKGNRGDINNKVSKSLKKRFDEIKKTEAYKIKRTIQCKQCNNFFEKKNKEKFCSKECRSEYMSPILSASRISKIHQGVVNGNGKKSIYNFKGAYIFCDSKIENACINYFEKLGAIKIERCKFSINYFDGSKIRKYIPDFKIEFEDKKIFIVEAKSFMSMKSINKKWRDYNRKSPLKKEALKKYCEDNNYTYFWFTKNLNLKYYNSI